MMSSLSRPPSSPASRELPPGGRGRVRDNCKKSRLSCGPLISHPSGDSFPRRGKRARVAAFLAYASCAVGKQLQFRTLPLIKATGLAGQWFRQRRNGTPRIVNSRRATAGRWQAKGLTDEVGKLQSSSFSLGLLLSPSRDMIPLTSYGKVCTLWRTKERTACFFWW